MLPGNWKFMALSTVLFGFIAFRTRTVFWLLTYGKPALVSAKFVKVFQIFGFIGYSCRQFPYWIYPIAAGRHRRKRVVTSLA